MASAVGHQLLLGLFICRNTRFQHDECLDRLHAVRIGNADDAAHLNLLMGIQDVFQLGGIDVVTGRDDHSLGASAEVDEAFIVHHAKVACVNPCKTVLMGAQGFGCFLGVVHIALHDSRTGKQNFTFLAIRHFLIGARLDNLDIGVREGQTDTAFLVTVARCQAARRDSLGCAIAFTHLDRRFMIGQEPVEFLLELNGQGVAAGEYTLQGRKVRVVHGRQSQQCFVECRHAGNEVALVLGDQLCIALGCKARHENASAALGKHCMNAYTQTETMEKRHRRQHSVTRSEHRVGSHDLLAQRIEILV